MRETINSEFLRELLEYDSETGKFAWKERTEKHIDKKYLKAWNKRYAGKAAFVHEDYGQYLRASIFGKFYSAHRVAWAIIHGDPIPKFLDHIDGNRQNNKIKNIRITDPISNSKNRGTRSDNTSGRTGIHKTKSGTYRVRIFVNGRDKYVGTFRNFEEAVSARKKEEKKYDFSEGHGERQGVAWKAVKFIAETYGVSPEEKGK